MTTVSSLSASKALRERLSNKYAKNANVTSGFISTVTNDSTGRAKSATVQLAGGTAISVQVPYGSNIYPGISVSLVNDGSPSLASWRISGSSSASPVMVGGQIVNQNGSIIANFDSIWVKDRGYIMAGGMEDILGEPTGPRVMMNEYGLFGYAIPFPEPVISIATIESDNLHVGDMLLGYKRPSQANLLISPEQGLIEFDVNDTPFLVINGATGNRLEDYLWIGPSSGPQVGMGKMLGVAEFAMRDLGNRYVFLVRSDPMRVQIGATDDEQRIVWDSGILDVTGTVRVGTTGALIWAGGKGVADASGISHTEGANDYWRVAPTSELFMEINASGGVETRSALQVTENAGRGVWSSGGYIGVFGMSSTNQIGVYGYHDGSGILKPGVVPDIDTLDPDMSDGLLTLGPGTSVYGLTQDGTAGRFIATGSGRGLVGASAASDQAGVTARNTGGGAALSIESSHLEMNAQAVINIGNLRFDEVATPGAQTDHAVVYAEDNGAGKTRLMVRFGSGAAQQLSIEP